MWDDFLETFAILHIPFIYVEELKDEERSKLIDYTVNDIEKSLLFQAGLNRQRFACFYFIIQDLLDIVSLVNSLTALPDAKEMSISICNTFCLWTFYTVEGYKALI